MTDTSITTNISRGVNWNDAPERDRTIWEKMWSQFWLADRMPLGNDVGSWQTLTEAEKLLTTRVFTGLTLLDTIQGDVGTVSMMKDANSLYEAANLTVISAFESIHAASYSKIFQTLCSTQEINEAFRWSGENKQLQYKAQRVQEIYATGDPIQKRIASVFLESFMFYSGFFLPLWFASRGKLLVTNDTISLIIRDESIHGFYIGNITQQMLAEKTEDEKQEYLDWAYDLLGELYDNEIAYTEELYDTVTDTLNVTEEVKAFLRYNANKALMNLGMDPLFPHEEINPAIQTGLSLDSATHDFFSTTGSTYVVGKTEETTDEDWDF